MRGCSTFDFVDLRTLLGSGFCVSHHLRGDITHIVVTGKLRASSGVMMNFATLFEGARLQAVCHGTADEVTGHLFSFPVIYDITARGVVLFCSVAPVLVTTSIGLAHATSSAVHLASFGGVSRAVFPVTIMLNGATDAGNFATFFEATCIGLLDAFGAVGAVALGRMHLGVHVVMLIALNGAMHLALAFVDFFVSVGRDRATSSKLVHLLGMTAVLVASGCAIFDALGAVVLVMMLTVIDFGFLEFLRTFFDGGLGFVAVDSTARSLVVNLATVLGVSLATVLGILLMLMVLEFFFQLVDFMLFVLFVLTLSLTALLHEVGVHSGTTCSHGGLHWGRSGGQATACRHTHRSGLRSGHRHESAHGLVLDATTFFELQDD